MGFQFACCTKEDYIKQLCHLYTHQHSSHLLFSVCKTPRNVGSLHNLQNAIRQCLRVEPFIQCTQFTQTLFMAFQSVIFALASLSAVGLVTANLQSIPRGVLLRSTAESCFSSRCEVNPDMWTLETSHNSFPRTADYKYELVYVKLGVARFHVQWKKYWRQNVAFCDRYEISHSDRNSPTRCVSTRRTESIQLEHYRLSRKSWVRFVGLPRKSCPPIYVFSRRRQLKKILPVGAPWF